ncbi:MULTISPECIES: ATP-binding protein [unclassified Duganella]|uniref:ATP-binding protein n=1 Tax=unclassified Duganella TaxID=2636909 RepID=UPI00087E9777|nr:MULTISPECIES: ATP-binding protein [unclassified Duganella]SDG40829.1 two-component system, OmpR family, sensor histidine kinase QseC [Duganella sp. OV458]SDJ63122.1 two-component system, OmpR family, sensor histidine kinase QseC [Duganella sp. OV510]
MRTETGAWSLRRRLLAAIIAASSVLWLASLGIVTVIAWHETTEVFDDALEESGYMIMAATTDWDDRGLLAELRPDGHTRKVDMQYQIVLDGRVIQRTGGAPALPFVAGFGKHDGFADAEVDQRHWRVFVVRNAQRNVEVQVGQQYKKRLDILEELAEHLWLPVTGMLVLLALVCWVLTGRVLKPLRQTAAAIAAKTPDDLTQVPTAGQPNELKPMVQALNGVLGRLDHALQAERRFTADAAHELRTPLAGLHMHVQLLQRQHPDLAAPFHKLRQDIGRSTALVDSLLTLARLDPLSHEQLAREPVALAPLLERLRATHATEADQRSIMLGVRDTLTPAQAQVMAHPAMLDIALRNLLENALRYCPDGSRIELVAGWHEGRVCIAVRDNGPGVDAASMQRLTERFFRVLGQDASGSGLGLSIVKRVADLHGMLLTFDAGLDGCGLGVTLALPPA